MKIVTGTIPMMKGTLTRRYLDNATLGVLTLPNFYCVTLELPSRDNAPNISCIPEGVYRVKKYRSPSLGLVWHLQDVKDRTWIYIHAGNYTRQIQGCILVGKTHTDIDRDGIIDVTSSRVTMDELLAYTDNDWELTIQS